MLCPTSHRIPPALTALLALALAALTCGPAQPSAAVPTAVAPTDVPPATVVEAGPTSPAPLPRPALGILIQTPDNALALLDPATLQSAPFTEARLEIMLGPYETLGVVGDTLYALGRTEASGEPPGVYAINAAGLTRLDQFGETIQSIAVLPGEAGMPPIIAWGEVEWTADPPVARLLLAPVGGFDATLVAEQATPEGFYFAPWRWVAGGQRLYYSEEPSGLGGYILFGGRSSLYMYDITTNTSSTLVPMDVAGGFICLDDLSPDETLVAHHCADTGIGLLNLQTTEQRVIQPPIEAQGWATAGSALFSPSGSRLAFAVARNSPDAEQGWVAVTDDLSGPSWLVATSPEGSYFEVVAWLDEQTLVLQSWDVTTGGPAGVWLAPLSGGAEPVRVADGVFVTLFAH